MDDGLVLNLATDDQPGTIKAGGKHKGGRWIDRLKANRTQKRKTRHAEDTTGESHSAERESSFRPSKRPRRDLAANTTPHEHPTPNTQPRTHIISSLFSSNPRVDPVSPPVLKSPSKPSNAPLLDSSSFTGLGLDPLLTAHLNTKMNITKPTSIQRAALSVMLNTVSEESHSRDVFIQAQTGSGKTLSFLLPIIQDLLPLSTHSYIDRSIGSLAIIIAPTRELAKQISDVLDILLKLRLRPGDESADDPEQASTRMTRWLISGLLTGGATRTHEKARLRKGVPILVSTPGRLLDHLQNTSSFDVGKCRWLVLDEADRLMELGFEETITGIIQRLESRRNLALQALENEKSGEVGGWDWTRRRITVLCSATIREDVQKLANTTLVRPLVIKATDLRKNPVTASADKGKSLLAPDAEEFTPPSQLTQKYIVVPLKLRLVTLVALLRSLIAKYQSNRGAKFLVFLSCTDSVDFHWHLLGNTSMEGAGVLSSPESDSDSDIDEDHAVGEDLDGQVKATSSLFPNTSIFRLHGSLPNAARLAALRGFSALSSSNPKRPQSSSILFCTSLAARGLDLPMVRAVIQHDLPTEGGATEYVHRVGRTARVGKGGEAWSLVAPSEVDWIKWVEEKMHGKARDDVERNVTLEGQTIENVLRSGFGGKGTVYEERATEVQLAFEKWVLRQKSNAECARKAFLSHMRAYATHPANEKHIFHIRHLHIGHLAKSFALREAPTSLTGSGKKANRKKSSKRPISSVLTHRKSNGDQDQGNDDSGPGQRMRNIVRAQGRLSKQDGIMTSISTSEFQIPTGQMLKRMVASSRT